MDRLMYVSMKVTALARGDLLQEELNGAGGYTQEHPNLRGASGLDPVRVGGANDEVLFRDVLALAAFCSRQGLGEFV
ncbi:hypothetical protein [Mycolicibacterium frederiksbergense]|uniref:hypothetical protein n=1 Tax=Mycolicibacterium frederiksbergense TaxID=117567 RepID=UPI001AE165B1|nr:hypothetical protein [Mycolicibacterium frederiksbergense]